MSAPHAGLPVLTDGVPLDESRCVIVMLHGRGAGPEDILGLAPALARPGVCCLAPTAADRTWYPYSFLSDTGRNEPYLSSALGVIAALVDRLASRGRPAEEIVLLGFSQGACLISEFTVRHPRRYGGLVALSGGLIGPPGTTWTQDGSLDGMPALFGCSDVDPHVPLERVDESVDVFRRLGATVTRRIYPGMGHHVNEDELVLAREIVGQVLDRT